MLCHRGNMAISIPQPLSWARVYQMIGMPLLFVPITTASYGDLPPDKTNQASALINISRGLFDTPLMFAALITLAALTLTFYLVAVLLERALVRWEP